MSDPTCRLCGDIKSIQNLTLTITDTTVQPLLEVLKVNLDDHKNLPNLVCLECSSNLEFCAIFTQRIYDVQEKLKSELLDQINETICDEYENEEHTELQIEKLDDVTEEDDLKIEISKARKRRKRNRGLKQIKDKIKYTMLDLFEKELNEGKFDSEVEAAPLCVPELLKGIEWYGFEWKCRGCNGFLSNVMDLEKHCLKCTKKRCMNTCKDCHKDYPSYSTFLNHIVDQHQPMLKYCCIICSEFKFDFIKLFRHYEKSHPEHSVFFCLYCGKFFFTGALLRDHLVIHKDEIVLPEYLCDICGYKTKKKQVLLSHMSRCHLARRFTCECCAFSFKYRSELLMHLQSQHSDECNEECHICGKKFKNKRKLRRHVRNIHEMVGINFNCEQCGKVSKNRKAHNTHMKIHSNVDCFQCTYCPRTFKHGSGFKYHLRTHTGEKPYLCPICDLKFIDWPNCMKHIKSSHGLTEVKPVQISSKN